MEDAATHRQAPATAAPSAVEEAGARRALRAQIARLERELARCVARATPRDPIDWAVTVPSGGPRMLTLGELEQVRDALVARLQEARAALAARAAREAEMRALLERMLRDPGAHRFVRIRRADVGEPGCGAWESRPRLGPIGLLAGWWRVTVSSGCPLRALGGAARRRPGSASLALSVAHPHGTPPPHTSRAACRAPRARGAGPAP